MVAARALGPEGRGVQATAIAVGLIGAQLLNLGLQVANTHLAASGAAPAPALFGNSLVVALGLGGPLAAAAWALLAFGPGSGFLPADILALALGWAPLAVAFVLLQSLLLGMRRTRTYNRNEVLLRALYAALVCLVVAVGWRTPQAVLGANVAATVVALSVVAVGLLRAGVECRPSLAHLRAAVGFGVRAYLGALALLLLLRVDLVLVERMLGAEQAGHYSVAVAMADAIGLLPVAVGAVLLPALSARRDAGERLLAARRAAVWTVLATALLCALAAVLARPALVLLFGRSYLPAVPAFWALLPAALLLAGHTVCLQLLAAEGMPWGAALAPLVGLSLNVGLNLLLLPRLGIVGAAEASALAYAALLLVEVAVLRSLQGRRRRAAVAAPPGWGR